MARWWFQTQIFFGIFTPNIWGKMYEPILTVAYFSHGVGEKPPSRMVISRSRHSKFHDSKKPLL